MMTEHAGERLNRRSLLLRLRKEIWIIPAMTLAGALAGALIYSVIWLAFSGQRQYRQTSKYYLTFGKEENGNAADYYNDYTWNDLIWSVPALSGTIEAGLPDGMTMEEAREDVEARILSDVRLLTIEVTDSDPSTVQELTNVMEDALTRFGKTAVQFDNIEFLSSGDVEAVVLSDRTRNAVLLGAFLGLLVSGVWLWLRELLNDGIYVPEDGVRRYGIPVPVVLPAEGTKLPDFLTAESAEAMKEMKTEEKPYDAVLTGEDPETTARAAAILTGEAGLRISTDEKDAAEAGRVVAVVPYGKANGTRTEHLLDHMKEKNFPAGACILADADGKFLRKYYGGRKSKQADRSA